MKYKIALRKTDEGYLNGTSIRDRRLNAKCGGRFFVNFSLYLFLVPQRPKSADGKSAAFGSPLERDVMPQSWTTN